MRLGAQLLDACLACATGELAGARVNFADDHALTVVMAARGYPGAYARGEPIALAETADPRVKVFHAGTRADRRAARLRRRTGAERHRPRRHPRRGARARLCRARRGVDWPGGFYRRDIGWRALAAAEA